MKLKKILNWARGLIQHYVVKLFARSLRQRTSISFVQITLHRSYKQPPIRALKRTMY